MPFSLQSFSLQGKVALITGGSRGIGKEIALGYANAGADIAIVGRKMPDLEQAAQDIEKLGRRCIPIQAHVGRIEDIAGIVSRAEEEFHRIDILVNNAATNPTIDPALEYTERAWDTVMNLNLKGLFFLSQSVAKVMKEKGGGSIINISSVEGISPGILIGYGISKAAVIHATKTLAKEWARYNIRVNAIAPSLVRTRFSERLWSTPELLQVFLSRTPMGRIAEPEEIVGAAIYFASSASSYVTGQVLAIDGGFTI